MLFIGLFGVRVAPSISVVLSLTGRMGGRPWATVADDAGHPVHFLLQPHEERGLLFAFSVLGGRQRNLRCEETVRIEAGVHAL